MKTGHFEAREYQLACSAARICISKGIELPDEIRYLNGYKPITGNATDALNNTEDTETRSSQP